MRCVLLCCLYYYPYRMNIKEMDSNNPIWEHVLMRMVEEQASKNNRSIPAGTSHYQYSQEIFNRRIFTSLQHNTPIGWCTSIVICCQYSIHLPIEQEAYRVLNNITIREPRISRKTVLQIHFL